MNIPGYDAWRLQGPDEAPEPVMEDCAECLWSGECYDDEGAFPCTECGGLGEVEVVQEEPDGDYEYERRRDLMEDNT